MKIYISHASSFDYKNELYAPLERWAAQNGHELFLPHTASDKPSDSHQQILSSDLLIAEVSYPSTGQGIELGWADTNRVNILAIHKEGTCPSNSVPLVAASVMQYHDDASLYSALDEFIRH